MKLKLSSIGSDFDAVLFHLIRTAQYANCITRGKRFIELTDYLPTTYRRSLRTRPNSIKWFLYVYELIF